MMRRRRRGRWIHGTGAVAALQAGLVIATGGCAIGAQDAELCLAAPIPMLEGAEEGCYRAGDLARLSEAAVLGSDGRPMQLTLTHPTDDGASEAVSTCGEFASRSEQGWYAATSRDLAGEAFFTRACGMLAALSAAEPPRVSFFHEATAARDMASILASELPYFGERVGPDPGDATLGDLAERGLAKASETVEGVWVIEHDQTRLALQDLVAADFDGDGAEDRLVYVRIGPIGGSASAALIAILKKSGPDAQVRMERF